MDCYHTTAQPGHRTMAACHGHSLLTLSGDVVVCETTALDSDDTTCGAAPTSVNFPLAVI